MEYKRLGRSGLLLSRVSFGSWVTFGSQVDVSLAKSLISTAYDEGINFFDNAEVYANGKSEEIMGQALKELGFSRDSYCVSSKVFWGGDKPTQTGLSRKHIFDACHAALKRLKVEYLDLYFCHRPDLDTPVQETVEAMSDLVRQGKILYWGTSEWGAQRLTEAYLVAKNINAIAPTMEQPEYNMFNRDKIERDYLPLFEQFGLGTTTWSPLASGVLTNKYFNQIPKDSRLSQPGYEWLKKRFESPVGQDRLSRVKLLEPISRELGCTIAQLAIAWCLRLPQVSTVILGASKLEQLKENIKALSLSAVLTSAHHEKIEAILQNRPEPEQDYK